MTKHRYNEYYDEFYHSSKWQAVRQAVLERDHYLCQVCRRRGIVKQATTVHHLTPLRVDYSKRLDIDNLETIHNQEHNERNKSLAKKQIRNKVQKCKDIISFSANEDF